MEELLKTVAKKANISEAQAKQAVDAVLAFLKKKLPGPIASQIEGALGGKEKDVANKAKDALGGLLGGKK